MNYIAARSVAHADVSEFTRTRGANNAVWGECASEEIRSSLTGTFLHASAPVCEACIRHRGSKPKLDRGRPASRAPRYLCSPQSCRRSPSSKPRCMKYSCTGLAITWGRPRHRSAELSQPHGRPYRPPEEILERYTPCTSPLEEEASFTVEYNLGAHAATRCDCELVVHYKSRWNSDVESTSS